MGQAVNNWEGAETLPHLRADDLVWHISVDTGRDTGLLGQRLRILLPQAYQVP